MDSLMIAITVAYIVGTGFGFYVGFNKGIRKGTSGTIDMLMDSNFLLYKHMPDGEIMFIKPEQPLEIQEVTDPQ